MVRINSIFVDELLPILRRGCHEAVCSSDVQLPKFDVNGDENSKRIHSSDVKIGNQLNTSVLDKCCAFVVYSEEDTYLNTDNCAAGHNEGVLLRGGVVRNANHDVQISVYAQELHIGYQLGDIIVTHFDDKAKHRNELRYFRLISRHGSYHEEVKSWVVVYRFKVQLQPKYEGEIL